jgi:branched-chain amino acid transport system substrate-binding protein
VIIIRYRVSPMTVAAVLSVGVLAATALVARGCTGPAPRSGSHAVFTVGLLAPLSGADVGRGKEAVQGAQLAVDVVNTVRVGLPLPLAATDGVRHGARFALVVGDANGTAADTQQLVRTHRALGLVVADQGVATALPTGHIDSLGVPLVDAGTAENALCELGVGRCFRVAPDDRALVRAAFGLIRQQRARGLPVRRVAVVEAANGGAGQLAETIREVSTGSGNDVTSLRYRATPTEIDPLYQQITSAGADVVFATVTSDAEAAAAAQLGERLRDRIPVIALGPGAGAVSLSGPGSSLLRTVGWSAEYIGKSPVARAVAELYKTRYGAALSEVAATAFTAVLAMASAVDSAATADGESVRAALRRTWFPGTQTIMPWDGVRFDASGQNELAVCVVDQRAGQNFRIVYPAELASAAVVWPAGKPLARS